MSDLPLSPSASDLLTSIVFPALPQKLFHLCAKESALVSRHACRDDNMMHSVCQQSLAILHGIVIQSAHCKTFCLIRCSSVRQDRRLEGYSGYAIKNRHISDLPKSTCDEFVYLSYLWPQVWRGQRQQGGLAPGGKHCQKCCRLAGLPTGKGLPLSYL